MRGRGRLLIVLGVLLGLIAAGGVLYVMMQGAQPTPTTPSPEVAVPTTQIIVAAQNIPRGSKMSEELVTRRDWPAGSEPPDVIADEAELLGKVASIDIYQGQPIVRSMLAEELVGSDAAKGIPEGKVAVAFPITRLSSVGYGIQAGDHVDVLLSARFIDREEEKEAARDTIDFRVEVMERLAAADVKTASFDIPAFEAKARPVTQLIVQNAGVLKVGAWETPTPPAPPEEEGAPAVPPSPPDMIILVVSQQDALVLKYARENNFMLDLVLRAAGDETPITTEAVGLEYMIRRFSISFPPELQYYLDTVPPVEEFVPERPEFPQETSIETVPLEVEIPEEAAP
jgi:Flp pilus assembly protein CpaB